MNTLKWLLIFLLVASAIVVAIGLFLPTKISGGLVALGAIIALVVIFVSLGRSAST